MLLFDSVAPMLGETHKHKHTHTRVRTARDDHNYIFTQDKRPRQVDTYANVFWYLSCLSNKLCNNQIPFFWHWHAPPFWKWFFAVHFISLSNGDSRTPDPIQVQSYRCVGIYSIIEWNGMDSDWIFNNHVLTRTDSSSTVWQQFAVDVMRYFFFANKCHTNELFRWIYYWNEWNGKSMARAPLSIFLFFSLSLFHYMEWIVCSSFEYLDAHEFGFGQTNRRNKLIHNRRWSMTETAKYTVNTQRAIVDRRLQHYNNIQTKFEWLQIWTKPNRRRRQRIWW